MSRDQRISFGIGCILLGLALLQYSSGLVRTIAFGLIGTGIAQFIGLPKDNVLPFTRRRDSRNGAKRK